MRMGGECTEDLNHRQQPHGLIAITHHNPFNALARHHHHGIKQKIALIYVQYRKGGNLTDGRIQRAAFEHDCMQHIGACHNRVRMGMEAI